MDSSNEVYKTTWIDIKEVVLYSFLAILKFGYWK